MAQAAAINSMVFLNSFLIFILDFVLFPPFPAAIVFSPRPRRILRADFQELCAACWLLSRRRPSAGTRAVDARAHLRCRSRCRISPVFYLPQKGWNGKCFF